MILISSFGLTMTLRFCADQGSGLDNLLSPSPLGRPSLLNAKANRPPAFLQRRHELADGVGKVPGTFPLAGPQASMARTWDLISVT